jgi:hypothetical protein
MCLKECERMDEADRLFATSIERCHAIAENSAGESREVFKRDEAFLLYESGQPAKAVEILKSIRVPTSSWNYDRPNIFRTRARALSA